MDMHSIALLACVAVTSFVFGIATHSPSDKTKPCVATETRRALRDLSRVTGWLGFYDSFRKFGRCDSGRIAEEYSYTLSRILAHNWRDLDLLLQLSATDSDFKKFVLKHIDENIPEDEAQLIMRNAREQCPSAGEWLCKAIVDY